MILSQYLSFSHSSASPGAAAIDPGRIAAQAITGIGFLGAGVIIRYKDSIRGLTTAACMWVMCAVGLSVGAGYYLYASVVSLMTLVSLIGVKMFTKKLAIDWYRDLVVVSEEREEQFERVQRAIEGRKATIAAFSLKKDRARQETTLMFRIKFHAAGTFDRKVVAEVYALPGIKSVELK
jgi:putative Mg2+ transporter-C (MgtC) family protein